MKLADVPLSLLELRWQNKLALVQTVRVGTELRAEYRIGRRSFYPTARWAVLPGQKELWTDADHDLHNAFFGAVSDLIFVDARPRYMPTVLKAALEAEVREFQRTAEDRINRGEPKDDAPPTHDDEDETGEALRPHPGGPLDPARNRPKPAPLHVGGSGKIHRQKRPASGRPQVVDEEIQRTELKENHYAWHCQIELANSGPETLAPSGSYVEYQENRQKVIEAHHPDKVSAGGPRNAGNLLILSHLNHERFGKAISRQQITDALLCNCEERTILTADGSPWVAGVVAQVVLPASGGKVAIFFTHDHRGYWLEKQVTLADGRRPTASRLFTHTPPRQSLAGLRSKAVARLPTNRPCRVMGWCGRAPALPQQLMDGWGDPTNPSLTVATMGIDIGKNYSPFSTVV